jgi:hypothetical protein
MCRSCYEKWLKNNNPKFLARQQHNARSWAKKFRERKRDSDKKWLAKQDKNYRRGISLHSRFGITLDDYDRMFRHQNGVCAICQKPSKRNLHIDHEHNTGKIRGLLCFRCNWGLSFFQENTDLLSRASNYVQNAEYTPLAYYL